MNTRHARRGEPLSRPLVSLAALALVTASVGARAQEPSAPAPTPSTAMKAETFTGLALRGIGPALTSGRVVDIAVHPSRRAVWYVAAASGGVWKTTDAGTTWTPLFDAQGSFSIGCLALDPRNPLVVWVGTGENNSQRSVGFGDGVYKSYDGGTTWAKVGLATSEHIGKIAIDPRNSDVVYVAAQGPLWAAGGERGLYKTTDGGKTWNAVLTVSENTGVNDVVFDPRNPDVLYASSYQRRRHVWTLIDGGPESAIFRSRDAGATWSKVTNGLPKEDMGRIGLAVSPANPDVVYALVEAANQAGGFFRSTDMGSNWERRSSYDTSSPQYYEEIFADPKDVGRVYAMDTYMHVTEDGGKTFARVPEKAKHVDNHALWIDPDDTDHLLAGCDGGVYETWSRGAAWDFKSNLPITQFYDVAVDNALPFYHVYGGTQDNNTLGGPSRTTTAHGIVNSDWFTTVGGDGFQTRVDPEEPDIVYSESQNGGLQRFDRRSGETVDIQPQPGPGDPPLRFNWDSPLALSPHLHTRLYYGAQRVFRSDDRGDSWQPISPDLTRQVDRNALEVMGRVWSVDAVAKNASTSFYGNLVALAESPLVEGLLYAGSDDGLVHVSPDGGATWRKIEQFEGVPERSYVARLVPSARDANTVFAVLGNHKMGDFKPYLLKSTDQGQSWRSIAGDLPERGPVWSVAEDPLDPDLLFAGTEFGLFFTYDGGAHWVQLKGNLPTIAVRDVAVQPREDDLVVATFGRGFYILDDYSPLRELTPKHLDEAALLFPVKRAWVFTPSTPLGLRGVSFQGDAFFSAPNPPFGAVFTYYLKDDLRSRKKARQKAERELAKDGKAIGYPSWDELRREDAEQEPLVILTVADEHGNAVRRLTGPTGAGFHRVAWDLRAPSPEPTELDPREPDQFANPDQGPLLAPGLFQVTLAQRVDGVTTVLAGPQTFSTEVLANATLAAPDRGAVMAFAAKTARLQRAVSGATAAADAAKDRLAHLRRALFDTPGADFAMLDEVAALEQRLADLTLPLRGDATRARRNEPSAASIAARVQRIVGGSWFNTQAATATHRREYDATATEFAQLLDKLRTLVEQDLRALEQRAEQAGAPWTPQRVPTFKAG